MTRLFEQILGLESGRLSDPDARLSFAHAIPGWAWVFLVVAAGAVAGWSYWKIVGKPLARGVLASLRALTLVLIALILAGPQLIKESKRTERDWVVLLADRSQSMSIADAPDRATREEQLKKSIANAWPALSDLASTRNLLLLGFDAGAYELKMRGGRDGELLVLDLGEAKGARTSLGRALDQTLRRVASRPVAGLVVLSDGRSSDTIAKPTLRQLESRQIPVFAVPLGSEQAPADLALARVESPTAGFVGDIIPVTADIEFRGDSAEPARTSEPPRAKVELVDQGSGRVLDSRELPPRTPGQPWRVTLTTQPQDAGESRWTVRVVPERPDLSAENNSQDLSVELVGRPVRVVYFDGYPRWEYRYVKNLLLREKSIRSSSLLLSPDKRYIQEGSEALDVLPRTPEAWRAIDVIVMGDLKPGVFSDEQLRQIKDHVALHGAGLLWIAGQGATPSAWRGTPLADLLPFALRPGADHAIVKDWLKPVVLRPTPLATRLGVLHLADDRADPSGWPEALSNPGARWPLLRWAQRLDQASLKPTAEVLASAVPAEGDALSAGEAPSPGVLTMRYGSGRVVYVATDEIWRYRYARGEALPERFYIPLIRLLARETLGRAGKAAQLEVSPATVLTDQQVQVTVRLLDETLVARRPANIQVRLTREGSPAIDLELRPEGLSDADTPASVFTARFVATDPGRYRVTSPDPLLLGQDASATLTVQLPEDEMRVPQADHATLATLAQATGGSVLAPERLSSLPSLLPNRELTILGTPQTETLWDKWAVWITLMALLVAEWVGRRVIRLS